MLQTANWLTKITIIFSLLGLSACSTNGFRDASHDTSLDFSSLYLRGVFTWWEADEAFKVEKVGDSLYRAQAKLIADGEPYDFKFADVSWTPGLSCGKSQDDDSASLMKLDKSVSADCYFGESNFKFVPEVSGTYYFYIDFSDYDEPEVYITL